MPTLYTMPGTCSLATNIAVAWLDAPVDFHNLDYGNHKREDYLAINPKGQVPALRFEDGDVLTEAAAILSYLGATYGSPKFVRSKDLGRKEAEALSYMTSGVHADFGPHFASDRFADSDEAQEEVKTAAYKKLRDHFERLDATVKTNGGEHYLGQRSFADAYLYVLTRWIEQTPLDIDSFPALKAHRSKLQNDPAVQKALKRQDMESV